MNFIVFIVIIIVLVIIFSAILAMYMKARYVLAIFLIGNVVIFYSLASAGQGAGWLMLLVQLPSLLPSLIGIFIGVSIGQTARSTIDNKLSNPQQAQNLDKHLKK